MAVERVKIVNPNGNVGWVAATYPPFVHGQLRAAPSEQAKRRRKDEQPATESTEPQASADEPSNTTEES